MKLKLACLTPLLLSFSLLCGKYYIFDVLFFKFALLFY